MVHFSHRHWFSPSWFIFLLHRSVGHAGYDKLSPLTYVTVARVEKKSGFSSMPRLSSTTDLSVLKTSVLKLAPPAPAPRPALLNDWNVVFCPSVWYLPPQTVSF